MSDNIRAFADKCPHAHIRSWVRTGEDAMKSLSLVLPSLIMIASLNLRFNLSIGNCMPTHVCVRAHALGT